MLSKAMNKLKESNIFPGKALKVHLFIVAFLFAAGCKVFEPKTGDVAVNSLDNLIEVLEEQEPQFNWMSAGIRVKVKPPDSRTLSGNGHVKIKKDSLMWITINKVLGIEVMRAQITPDSIKVLDRINNKYKAYPFRVINNYLNTASRSFTFENLTNLMTGLPVFPISKEHSMQADSTSITLSYKSNVFNEMIAMLPGILKAKQYKLEKNATKQSITINYGSYKKVKRTMLPGTISLSAMNPEPFNLDIKLSNITFKKEDQVSFTVPAHYE